MWPGPRKKGPRPANPATTPSAVPTAKLTTKIHLPADARCRPLAFVLTAGQAGDAPASPEVMARLRVPRRRGRPRTRPDVVLADKAYSSHAIRGRPPAFDREAYKQRNTVERCINRLKQRRGIATRYEKTATIDPAGPHIAGIFLWSTR